MEPSDFHRRNMAISVNKTKHRQSMNRIFHGIFHRQNMKNHGLRKVCKNGKVLQHITEDFLIKGLVTEKLHFLDTPGTFTPPWEEPERSCDSMRLLSSES